DREASFGQSADQHQLSGLIRRERDADAVRGEPVHKTSRGADPGRLCRLLAWCALAACVSLAVGRQSSGGSADPGFLAGALGLFFAGGCRLGRRRQRVTSENAGAKADRTQFSPLPLVAHADLAAYAVDIVAEGDIDLAEARGAGAEIDEVYAGAHLAPTVREVVCQAAQGASERGVVAILELVPHAADQEGLDGQRAGPHARAEAEPETPAHAGAVVEVHSVGALREVVDLAVDHADRRQRLEEHAGREAAEAR